MAFSENKLNDIRLHPENYKLIEKLPITFETQTFPFNFTESDRCSCTDESCRHLTLVIVDLETTGLDYSNDRIIEIGMVKVTWCVDRKKVIAVADVMTQFEDPGIPIPAEVTRLTKITDDDVRGHRIDDDLVSSWFNENDTLVVAHNASFDRPFFDRRFPELANLPWACSCKEIDWKSLGFESSKLERLLDKLHWFYSAHRALNDCLAVAWLFHEAPESFEMLINKAVEESYMVRAKSAPFELKDDLKANGYLWHPGDDKYTKHWWRNVYQSDYDQEKQFLDSLPGYCFESAHIEKLGGASKRFKCLKH